MMSQNTSQIHLSLNRYHNMMSIHIHQVILPYQYQHDTITYVRVQLLDDTSQRLDQTTPLYKHSLYDEHISWEMNKEDYFHPLRVSVYKREHGGALCIGHVDIKLSSLLSSSSIRVNHWLPLAQQHSQYTSIKSRRHVSRRKRPVCTSTYKRLPQSTLPRTNILIARPSSSTSFGFSVAGRGDGPVHVIRIQSQSPAALAGLQPGDQIVSIEGINVQHYNSDNIVQLLKQQSVLTEICVQRDSIGSTPTSFHNTGVHTHLHILHQSLPIHTSTNSSTTSDSINYDLSFISDTCRYAE